MLARMHVLVRALGNAPAGVFECVRVSVFAYVHMCSRMRVFTCVCVSVMVNVCACVFSLMHA